VTRGYPAEPRSVTVTFADSGDAFGSGGRYQACIHRDSSPSRYFRPYRRTAAFPNTPATCMNISLNASAHVA
jgi:hypothetical protein